LETDAEILRIKAEIAKDEEDYQQELQNIVETAKKSWWRRLFHRPDLTLDQASVKYRTTNLNADWLWHQASKRRNRLRLLKNRRNLIRSAIVYNETVSFSEKEIHCPNASKG
jgi:hypothetical protein